MVTREELSAMKKRSHEEAAREQCDSNELWQSIDSMAWSLNPRYLRTAAPAQHFEIDLHDMWHAFYLGAINTDAAHPAQDRLVLKVLQAGAQGVLARRSGADGSPETAAATAAAAPGKEGCEAAVTAQGTIWTDLPYLASDMADLWTHNCAAMSSAQRSSFSAALARLASVGAAGDRVSGICLLLMREALETPRALGRLDETEAEDAGRAMDDLGIAALLPAANMWVFHAGARLAHLCCERWNDCPAEIGRLGPLARQVDAIPERGGFSAARWMFWLRRLGEIAEEAAGIGNERLANFALRMMGSMVIVLDNSASPFKIEPGVAGRFAEHTPFPHVLTATGEA